MIGAIRFDSKLTITPTRTKPSTRYRPQVILNGVEVWTGAEEFPNHAKACRRAQDLFASVLSTLLAEAEETAALLRQPPENT